MRTHLSPCRGTRGLFTLLVTSAGLMAARAAPITPGNLVVLRAGDGTAVLGTGATAAFFDEYTTAGALVQSIPVPVTGGTALTITGSATTEGIMTRSQNGAKLLITGYRKDAGGLNPSGDAPATTNRVIGILDASGTVDTSIALTDPTGTIRSATSVDGSTTGPLYFITSTSVRYAAAPGAATTSVSIDNRNSRQAYLSGGVLYASNGSTTITGKVQHYGTLPTTTTAATPVAVLALLDAVNGFWMTDLNPAVPGDDTLYATSTVENLVRKFTFDGAVWTANGTIPALNAQNITGVTSGTSVTLYLASPSGTNRIYSYTDASGYNGALTGTLTTLVTAATNTGFRGISMFPGTAPPPAATFAGMVFLAGGNVRLTWNGTAGFPPTLQVSPDLTGWTLLGTATEAAPGVFDITDSPPAGTMRRFYRVKP